MSDAPPASDPAKRHSAALTDGPDRAGARAMLKAIGFTDEDLAKPLVGVATTWIETMPCNYNQRRLAEHVKAGIRAAGGTPMEFNTIAVSDGVTMGTEGMKASLDQPRGHRRLDRAGRPRPPARRRRLPRRLRQDASRARRWRSAASTCPAWPSTAARSTRASYKGVRERDGRDRLRGDRRLPGRQDHASSELYEIENAACPGPGACGGQFTANTMSTVMEFIGLSPAGLNGIPAEDPAKDAAAHTAGELVMDLVRRDVRPSSIVTRTRARERRSPASPRPAARPTASSTCWRSPTSSASRSTSTSSGRSPTGRRSSPTCSRAAATPRTDMYEAGGVRARHARAAQAARPAPRRRADRRRPDDRRRSRPRSTRRRARRSSSRSRRRSSRPAGWPSCTARWRPTAAWSSSPATSAASIAARPACSTPRRPATTPSAPSGSSPATSSSSATRARSAGPGMQEMLQVTARARRRGSRRLGRAAHRRPVLGRHPRPDDRPRRAGGGARRPDRDRRGGRHDRHRRRPRARSTSTSPPDEVARRFEPLVAARRPLPAGVMAKYAALVGSASEGAVTTGPRMTANLAGR